MKPIVSNTSSARHRPWETWPIGSTGGTGKELVASAARLPARFLGKRNLEEAVQTGAFRKDLFYRINLFVIEVPPLRERSGDIPELAGHFLKVTGRSSKYNTCTTSDSALAELCEHRWPGNVRELRNAIERAMMVCPDEEIQVSHLPAGVLRGAHADSQPAHSDLTGAGRNLVEAVEDFERAMILEASEKSNWNKTQAARLLGVTRRILSYKVSTLGIDKTTTD